MSKSKYRTLLPGIAPELLAQTDSGEYYEQGVPREECGRYTLFVTEDGEELDVDARSAAHARSIGRTAWERDYEGEFDLREVEFRSRTTFYL